MKLSGAAKRMITIIGISFIVLTVGGFAANLAYFYSFRPIPFAIGAFIGCAASALKVIMLDRAITKSFTLDAADAKNYIGLQAFGRFILTGAAVAIAAFNHPQINLWGTAAGILTMQIAAVSMKNYVEVDEHPQKTEN